MNAIIHRVLHEQLKCRKDEIKPDTKLRDLGADSMDAIEIGCVLEDEFNLAFGDLDGVITEAMTVAELTQKCAELTEAVA